MSTELDHLEPGSGDKTDSLDGSPKLGGEVTGWAAKVEAQIRKFPREAILISFILGALLQSFTGRSVLTRLLRLGMWSARPFLIGFAAWRLYQSVCDGRSSCGGASAAADEF